MASTEEFGVPNASYPVLSLSTDTQVYPHPVLSYITIHRSTYDCPSPQSIAEEPQPIMRLASPTPSLPNPYTTSLRRTQTASSVASSTFTLGSAEFGPRPRPKLTLTLSSPDSKPSISTTVIAINETDALLPNPFQPQANPQSYFSPHTPAHPPTTATDPPIQTGVTSSLGADLNTGFGVSYFSPHTPATTGMLSSLGTGNTTTTPSTGLVGTTRARQTEKGPEVRASGLLAPPSSAAFGSYWSPHTPVVPEGLEGAIEDVVGEEPEEVSMKETEYVKADHKTRSFTTTIATDGHSAGPSSTSHCDPSSPSDEVYADTDVAVSTSDSSSSIGSRVLVPNKPYKPQLRLQTWGLDKMREEKKRQGPTAVRRQGSKDKDARNRERKATKATERTIRREAEMSTQTTGATKGGSVPPMLKPIGDQVAWTPRPPQLVIGSNSTPGGQEKSERPSIPATLRPGSLYQAVPPPAQLALRSRPVLNIRESPAMQGTDTIDIRNSTATNAVWDLTLDARPQLDLTLTNPYLPPDANSNIRRDWSTRGRTPSEPNVPTARVLGVGAGGAGGTQGQELERNSMPRERRRFGFFGNTGAAASDTNLAGVAASSRPAPLQRKSKDDKEVSELKENRKNAFYSRGINASLEALAGWGGKVFSHSSTTVNTHGHGQLSRKGEKDEHPTVPYPQHHVPSQIGRLPTPPLTGTQRQYTPPQNPSPPNMRVYQAPLYPPGDRGPSFEDFGVEIGRAGRNKTHTPPLVADDQQFKKGHMKNSSSGLSGFRKMFGFGKKEKEKGKQKWI